MSNAQHVIGMDLGGTHLQAGLVAANGDIVHRLGTKTHADRGPEGVLHRIAEFVRELLLETSRSMDDVAGVGIGAPGAIDIATGTVVNAPNLRWTSIPLAARLSAMLGDIPVVVDNDVNVAVLGENVFGAGRDSANALGVWVGTGIGGGIILDHAIHHGPLSAAGEIGHMVLFPDAREGRRKLEHLASRKAVHRIITDAIGAGEVSSVADLVYGDTDSITAKEIAIAYTEGDPVALREVNRAADLLGLAIANALGLLSIDVVLLGGGLTEALGAPYVDRVRASFKRWHFPTEHSERVDFRMTELHENAGLLGAALLALQRAGLR